MPQRLPLISVVMCTYNGEAHVGQQLDSILSQTFADIEVIINDDDSTDRTYSILKTYAAKDPRIDLHRNRENLGYNKNFEKALMFARGEWIAISDQDDIWLPNKLATLYNHILPGTLLVHSYNAEFKNDDPAVTLVNSSRVRFRGSNTRQLLFYNTVSGHALMLHKKLLQYALPFPNGIYYDWWLALNASIQGAVALYDEALVLHRQHDSNASHLVNESRLKEKFFAERIHALQSFTKLKGLKASDLIFLRQYERLLQTQWSKNFSLLFFIFFLQHAKTAFYFRKKKFMLFYYLKYAFKRATLKVKHWT